MTIIPDSTATDRLGYGDCSPVTNGEYSVLENLIESGWVVFDVGANKGVWGQQALRLNPEIHLFAFEPIKEVYLQLSLALPEPHKAFNLALSNTPGEKSFWRCMSNEEMGSLYDRSLVGDKLLVNVKADTLDNVARRCQVGAIDYLKIDTEGEELNILKGATGLLERGALKRIQFEYGGCYRDAGSTLKDMYDLLVTKHDMMLFRLSGSHIIEIDKWRPELENFQYCNYLAIRRGNANTGVV